MELCNKGEHPLQRKHAEKGAAGTTESESNCARKGASMGEKGESRRGRRDSLRELIATRQKERSHYQGTETSATELGLRAGLGGLRTVKGPCVPRL